MPDDREALKARFAALGPTPSAPPPLPQGAKLHVVDDVLSETTSRPVMPPGSDKIQLKIKRDQAKSTVKGLGFSIYFIAEMSPEARAAVKYYRLGDAVLYQKDLDLKLSPNVLLMAWRAFMLWFRRKKWRVTVNDLVEGRTLTAKSVMEMLEIEDDLRKAADRFVIVLRAAAWFGGEEVIDL